MESESGRTMDAVLKMCEKEMSRSGWVIGVMPSVCNGRRVASYMIV